MIRFRNLKIRTKLALAMLVVLLPLLLGEAFTIFDFQGSLRDSAELELSNTVRYLYRICELMHRADKGKGDEADGRPLAGDVAFLRKVLLSARVGRTGYSYVMDTRGTLIIHPVKEGANIYHSRDSQGHAFIQEICRKAVRLGPKEMGTIRYPWQNVEEGEKTPRMKIVKYMYFREWNWIVAAGAYEEEIYEPVSPATRSALSFFGVSVLLVILLTWLMSRWIARPLVRLSHAAERFAAGELEQTQVLAHGNDELAVLARSFADMAGQIGRKREDLERLVREKTKELNDSREQYRSLVENTIDCIVTADRTGTITFANSGMENLLGIPRDEIMGRKIWEFYAGGLVKAREIMRRIRMEGSVRNFEQQLILGDRRIPIMTSATMLHDADGKEIGTIGVFTDVTKLKELENELAQAQVNLAQTNKMRALGDLVAGVAHEINNPLMASTTMLRVIERGIDKCDCESSLADQVDVLKRCNKRIAKIVNHLREFSRQSDLEKRRIHINQPIRNALLIATQQLMNLQIEVEAELDEDLPPVFADANLLEQVFLDLFANARDAMEDISGEKKLRITSRRGEIEGQPAVQVVIKDTGPGIPLEIQDKIFDPFFTTKPVGKGTGLGLPICYGIIENHGGRIALETSEQTGTEVTITIPAQEEVGTSPRPEEGKDEPQDPAD